MPELRIAFICPGRYPPDFGGAELRLHRTFLRLRQYHTFQVTVLAQAGESTSVGHSELDGIPVRRLPADPGVVSSFCSIGKHLVGEIRSGANIIYTVSTGRFVYWTGIWARLLHRPLVVEFANNNVEDTLQRRLMAQMLARSAELAIAISRPVADQFRRLGVPEERIWMRPNPVDTRRFRLASPEQRAAARRRFGVDEETILHVLVGVLSERKNHIVGIEAIERLPEPHRLIIAGPPFLQEPEYAAQLAQRVRSSSAGQRLSLIAEFMTDVEELMHAADCLWMPSIEEGLGNVMLEALCCGVPCVISNRLGLEEHVSDGQNGFQAEPTAEAWAKAVLSIIGLLRDVEARKEISEESCALYDCFAIDSELFRRLNSLCK
ncbi:MAG: glycosyltransferase family 4 protein [Rhodospirillales bacterium]|nr:glycosyltransferase family 4 protein [Rhodospirillales bacterium]